jgi:hypothetical protein
MPGLTNWDIGACCCDCPCYPCTLPQADVTLSYSNYYTHAGSAVLTYGTDASGACHWISGNITWGAIFFTFEVHCSDTCSWAIFFDNPSGSYGWDHPAACAAFPGNWNVLALQSGWTCSPLSVTWRAQSGPFTLFTVTP